MTKRQLKLGAVLAGVGTTQDGWQNPDVPGDASIDIDWYKAQAKQAEDAKFDFIFIVDSPYITPDSAPHYLNRLEPLTLLSAVAGATTHIGFLRGRGLLRTDYEHHTLRENLGLKIPENRHTVARESAPDRSRAAE